jgi:hypothetical protein
MVLKCRWPNCHFSLGSNQKIQRALSMSKSVGVSILNWIIRSPLQIKLTTTQFIIKRKFKKKKKKKRNADEGRPFTIPGNSTGGRARLCLPAISLSLSLSLSLVWFALEMTKKNGRHSFGLFGLPVNSRKIGTRSKQKLKTTKKSKRFQVFVWYGGWHFIFFLSCCCSWTLIISQIEHPKLAIRFIYFFGMLS